DDTLDLVVRVPVAWKAAVAGTAHIILAAGQSVDRDVRVDVPDQAGAGEAAATVVVSAHGAERARVAITVEVGRSQEHGFRRAVMTTGIVSTRDETGNGYSIGAATISGALTADVDVSGRFTSALPTDAASAVAMSTL